MRSSGAPVSYAAGCPRRFAPRRPLNAIVSVISHEHNVIPEVVRVGKDIMLSIAAIIAAYLGFRGLDTWRRQLPENWLRNATKRYTVLTMTMHSNNGSMKLSKVLRVSSTNCA